MNKELLQYFSGDELAAGVWLNKYAQEGETTPDDMHKRMAKEFAKVEQNYTKIERDTVGVIDWNNLSHYGRHRDDLDVNKIYNFFKDFKYIIPQGSVMSQLGSKSIGSLSNCFVVGQPIDSYAGIMQKDQQLVQLMKRRGGVGIDISTLRPEGTLTSNAAKSSTGAVSFMHRFSNTTREVAQNGRRGALMISIDINHPDVMEFIKIKRDLSQVTGANISIKLNDEFMKAVEADEDYILRFPCDLQHVVIKDNSNSKEVSLIEYCKNYEHNSLIKLGPLGFIKKIKAKEYYDEIIKSAHNVAEPGLMFWDTMVNYSPDGVYPQFKQVTTNPCSEIGMQPYDACRLIVTNLYNFVKNPFTKDSEFDYDEFYKINYEAMRLSDDLIDLEIEYINRILNKINKDIEIEKAKNILSTEEVEEIYSIEKSLWTKVLKTAQASRRTGLGFTALADTLAALGYSYDSKESLEIIEKIMQTKMKSELDCTIDLAILRGTFEGWNPALEAYGDEYGNLIYGNDFYDFLHGQFPEEFIRMSKYGRRNVSWSTVAPTGSVSLLAQTTSGIEPLFMPFYIRRKKVNPGEDVRVDFTDQNGDTWQEFPVLHPKFKDWILYTMERDLGLSSVNIDELDKSTLQDLFEASPYFGSTANDIDWIKRVELQGIIQKYITHSISSTINLPENVSESEVFDIYLESWKKGLKGITVYRDGSRSGVLVSQKDTKEGTDFEYHDAIKRPKELKAEAFISTSGQVSFNVFVGLLNDKPYEIFIDTTGKFKGKGILVKEKRGYYKFIQGDKEHLIDDITDEQAAITRLTSTSLRHRTDIKFIVEQLNKCDGDLFSFTKSLARVLKKYIPDGTKSSVKCYDCGSDNVIFEEGCNKCLDCGASACS